MSERNSDKTLPLFQSPLIKDRSSIRYGELPEEPTFRQRTETSNAELFYDLFFVANLTVFTAAHEVNDRLSLTSYIGFFSILWFTWYRYNNEHPSRPD